MSGFLLDTNVISEIVKPRPFENIDGQRMLKLRMISRTLQMRFISS